MVIAVSHRLRALVRAATLLVAPDLAAALRDQPAVEEAIAWAAVASAVGDAAAEAVAAAAEVGGNGLSRKKIKSIPMRRGNRPTMTGPGPKSEDKCSLTIDF